MTNPHLKQKTGNKNMFGVVISVLLFAAVACVAQQFGADAGDAVGTVPDQSTSGEQNQLHKKQTCPPDSYVYTNSGSAPINVSFGCSGNHGGTTTVPAGGQVVFKESCPADATTCKICGLLRLGADGIMIFSCEMQAAYFEAYGIDIAAMGFTATDSDLERPRKVYNSDGDPVFLNYHAVPVIDEDGEFAGWETTTIEPNFSVEDDEVVIRDNRGRVIGDRSGLTPGKQVE